MQGGAHRFVLVQHAGAKLEAQVALNLAFGTFKVYGLSLGDIGQLVCKKC